ncbi:hypothetical protein H4R18_005376 [Coemansia javaensis]|uniref:Uncharacterized protein n=1 Tax=Coemansia javaensis TaxID=2761396 RepID=A0A9W8LFN9_9FUNG|nr:hypothetical protein H4R18_005376 [Coemansia javaensis]
MWSARVGLVLLPAAGGLAVLALAVVALWRSWADRRRAVRGALLPHEHPAASAGAAGCGFEHAPLLIDNDPASRRQAAPIARRARRPSRPPAAGPGSGSLEEQYGSLSMRSGNMLSSG